MSKTTEEDLRRKLKALVALRDRASNEHEQAAAAERIAVLVARYNLEHLDLSSVEEEVSIQDVATPGKYNETWRKSCWGSAAQMYMCHYFYFSQPGHKTAAVIHHVIGEAHNVAVAVDMAGYFESSINRLANEAAKNQKLETATHTHRHRFIRSFRFAAANRLAERVVDYVTRARAGTLKDAETGTTLPALNDLFTHQRQLYEAWLTSQGIVFEKARESRDQQLSRRGRALGRQAGEDLSLNAQLEEGGRASAFALT